MLKHNTYNGIYTYTTFTKNVLSQRISYRVVVLSMLVQPFHNRWEELYQDLYQKIIFDKAVVKK